MLDRIGVLFDTKTKALSTNLTNKITDNIKEIKSDVAVQIKANTEHLMDCFAVFNKKSDMEEKLMLTVSDSVKTAYRIISGTKYDLVKISNRVDQNKDTILINTKKQRKLEEMVKHITDERI